MPKQILAVTSDHVFILNIRVVWLHRGLMYNALVSRNLLHALPLYLFIYLIYLFIYLFLSNNVPAVGRPLSPALPRARWNVEVTRAKPSGTTRTSSSSSTSAKAALRDERRRAKQAAVPGWLHTRLHRGFGGQKTASHAEMLPLQEPRLRVSSEGPQALL